MLGQAIHSLKAALATPDPAPVSRTWMAIACLLGAGFVLCLALNLPGHLSYDSIIQLWEGRTGVYNTWHPPVMAWMLGLADSMVPGAALFVIFDAVLLYGAFLAILALRPTPHWRAALVALVWLATPQGLIYPGIVWKDVLFAAATAAAFAALAWAEITWPDPRRRALGLAGAAAMAALAALARQNGVVVLVGAAGATAWIAGRNGGQRPARAALAYGAGFLAAAGLAVALSNAALALRGDGEPAAAYQIQDLQAYDLIAAVKIQPDLELKRLHEASPRLEHLIRTDGVKAYSPSRIDSIQELQNLQATMSALPSEVIGGQWRDLVTGHPLLYLRVRAAAFGWVFLTPTLDLCLPVYVGVDGPQPWMGRLGLKTRVRASDDALAQYAESLVDTPLYSHVAYALLAVAMLARFVIRRRGADIAMAGLLASALGFTATFFVISVSCDYRYLYALDVSVILAAFYLALGVAGGRPRPRQAGTPPPQDP